MSGLTIKQRLFIDEYLKCFNATEAARRAGYQGNDNTLSQTGHKMVRNGKTAERIKARLDESAMSTNEALGRLADMARSDIGDFIKVDPKSGDFILNWKGAKGKTHLIKSAKHTAHGFAIELHDPQAAIDKILKAGGEYTQHIDIKSGGEIVKTNTIIVREIIDDS